MQSRMRTPSSRQRDVLRLEVAVPVADPPRDDAVLEQRLVGRHPAGHRVTDLLVRHRVEDGADEATGLLEVGVPCSLQRVSRPGFGDRGGSSGGRMKRGKGRRNPRQPDVDVRSLPHQGGQPPLVGQGSHHHHVVDRLALHDDVGHAQVDVGRQAAVELDLTPAVGLPDGTVREVEEVKMHGLAEAWILVPHEDEDGDVRLEHDPHRRRLPIVSHVTPLMQRRRVPAGPEVSARRGRRGAAHPNRGSVLGSGRSPSGPSRRRAARSVSRSKSSCPWATQSLTTPSRLAPVDSSSTPASRIAQRDPTLRRSTSRGPRRHARPGRPRVATHQSPSSRNPLRLPPPTASRRRGSRVAPFFSRRPAHRPAPSPRFSARCRAASRAEGHTGGAGPSHVTSGPAQRRVIRRMLFNTERPDRRRDSMMRTRHRRNRPLYPAALPTYLQPPAVREVVFHPSLRPAGDSLRDA